MQAAADYKAKRRRNNPTTSNPMARKTNPPPITYVALRRRPGRVDVASISLDNRITQSTDAYLKMAAAENAGAYIIDENVLDVPTPGQDWGWMSFTAQSVPFEEDEDVDEIIRALKAEADKLSWVDTVLIGEDGSWPAPPSKESNPSAEDKERRRQRSVKAEKAKSKRRKKRGKRRRKNPAFEAGDSVDVTLTVPTSIFASGSAGQGGEAHSGVDVEGDVIDTWEDEEGSNLAVYLEGPNTTVVLRQEPGEPLWWLADEVSVKVENPSNPRIVPEEIRVRSIRPGMSEEEAREEEKRNEMIRQWIRETATPQAILRGEREEVVVPELREPVEGRRRIYVPEKRARNPGVTASDLARRLKF